MDPIQSSRMEPWDCLLENMVKNPLKSCSKIDVLYGVCNLYSRCCSEVAVRMSDVIYSVLGTSSDLLHFISFHPALINILVLIIAVDM